MKSLTPSRPVGRPSDYRPEYIGKVDEYIATTGREQTTLPTLQGLAVFLGTSMTSVQRWEAANPEFRLALDKLMAIQGEQLINDGIYGGKEVNSTIVKLLLMNNHGMREKTDTDLRIKELPKPIVEVDVLQDEGNQENPKLKEKN